MSITILPLELLFEVAHHLEAFDYIHLAGTCKHLYQSLQSDKLSWLINEGLTRKAAERLQVIKSSSRMVLSHALIETVRVKGPSNVLTKPLLANGASFRHVGYGRFLEEAFRTSGSSPRVKFALNHGASLWEVSCGLPQLLEDTIRYNPESNRSKFLLQHAKLDDVACGKEVLMADITNRSGASRIVNFLIQNGGDPPDKAKYLEDVRRVWGAGPQVTQLVHKGYAPNDEALGEILETTFWKYGPGPEVDELLKYDGLTFAKVPGGFNNLLKSVLQDAGVLGRIQRAEYLLEQGASLSDLSPSVESVMEHVLLHFNSRKELTNLIRWFLRKGAPLDRVPNGVMRHLENVFEDVGPGEELEQLERTYETSLDQVEGGLDRLLLKHFLDLGPDRTTFLIERGASLPDLVRMNNLLERSFIIEGRGPRTELLLDHGASFQNIPMGLPALLQRTVYNQGKGPAKDYLVSQGASPYKMPDGINRVLATMRKKPGCEEEVNWLLDMMTQFQGAS